ncbi:PAS domain-containing protein [Pontibacter sp. E15-1]|uniref:PAS domain-containing protein n=1 Tax=Pontibacter sp. E15-1 TaxID=2919918 RepID=UPI001F4FC142|nr:PAS domain-containing protein [Pontibacter sp. E15-1]MCJ8165048.1 PAS domain-containing protein [Pontibacter sp. E15-1]
MDYKKLFLSIPESIVILSTEYKVLDATEAYLKATIRKREDLIGKYLLEEFPDNPHDEGSRNVKTLRDSLDNALKTKKIDYFPVTRYDIPRPEELGGGYDFRYWEATHTPVLDDDGEVMYIVQRTTDVTEREMAKQALIASERKYRFMAEAIPMLISTSKANGEPIYFNQSWISYTGRSMAQLFASLWSDFVHPDDVSLLRQRWESAMRDQTNLQAEVRILDKNGTFRWHSTRSTPMKNAQGEVEMWVSSSTDIHDTRHMVHELLVVNEQASVLSDQVQDAFRKAEAERRSLTRVIMQAPAMMCILKGPDHRFELVNPLYQGLFPDKELIGRTVAEALPEVVEQGIIELLDNVYQTGEIFTANERCVKIDRSNTGELEEIYINFSYQPLYNEHDSVSGILVFALDVSEMVNLKHKLHESGHASL